MKNTVFTVYKQELKLRFSSLSGWLFLTLSLLAVGVSSGVVNFMGGYNSFEYALESAAVANCVIAPLLAATTLSAERGRGETDLLMRYMPVYRLVLGKYLAWLTLFGISLLFAAALPPILGVFGAAYLPSAYLGILGYALFGAAILALCLFVACTVARPWLCFLISAGASALLLLCANLSRALPSTAALPFVIFSMLMVALVTVLLYFYFEKPVAAVAVAVVGSILTTALTLTERIIPCARTLMRFLSPFQSLVGFTYGVLEISSIIQLLCFAVILVCCAILRLGNYRRR